MRKSSSQELQFTDLKFRAHWTVNDELPNRLSCGTILVKPNIQAFTETGLNFQDGSEAKNVDQVFFVTTVDTYEPMYHKFYKLNSR